MVGYSGAWSGGERLVLVCFGRQGAVWNGKVGFDKDWCSKAGRASLVANWCVTVRLGATRQVWKKIRKEEMKCSMNGNFRGCTR